MSCRWHVVLVITVHVAPDTITTLANETEGQFLVLTSSGSLYLLHLGNRTQMRVRFDDDRETVLRRDGELVDLLQLSHAIVSERMVMWLDVRRDGVPTLRSTTPVVSIRRVVFDELDSVQELSA